MIRAILYLGLLADASSAQHFEVAAIRPSPSVQNIGQQIEQGKLHVGMAVDHSRVDIGTLTIFDLISIAYRLKPYELPNQDWVTAAHWDIVAKLPDGASQDQIPEMLRALLEERFKLQVHREIKEQNVYALVIGKAGPKLKEAGLISDPLTPGSSVLRSSQGTIDTASDGTLQVSGPGGPIRIRPASQQQDTMVVEIPSITMAHFVDLLRLIADKPVIDMTRLKGNYEVSLELGGFDVKALTREAMGLGMMPDRPSGAFDVSGSAVFKAVERLGLKLESRKMPIEMIVVDHVEKAPTEN